MRLFIFRTICPIWVGIALSVIGCGGGTTTSSPTKAQGAPIDPSGNWKLVFTDTHNNTFLLSALFSQTESVVTGLNFSEVGNGSTFQCAVQPNVSMANGQVQNVSTFSGDLSGNFGTIHFSTTLNDAGTHSAGTYTVTPGANGNCLGVALTGTLTADEIPSVSGNWTGTINCVQNCPTGSTSGTLTMSLTQNDSNGVVTGSYATNGLPGISSGNFVSDPLGNNFISGASVQQRLLDGNGQTFFLVGGPLNSFGTSGLGLDRSFHGNITAGGSIDPIYAVGMTH
jgi:hypothetical protein